MLYTRRELGKLALTALPVSGILGTRALAGPVVQGGRPNSTFAGVRVGLNVPYNFGGRTMPGGETLERCLTLGASHVELRSQPVEMAMGSPAFTPAGASTLGRGATPAEQQAAAAAVAAWRRSVSLSGAEAVAGRSCSARTCFCSAATSASGSSELETAGSTPTDHSAAITAAAMTAPAKPPAMAAV